MLGRTLGKPLFVANVEALAKACPRENSDECTTAYDRPRRRLRHSIRRQRKQPCQVTNPTFRGARPRRGVFRRLRVGLPRGAAQAEAFAGRGGGEARSGSLRAWRVFCLAGDVRQAEPREPASAVRHAPGHRALVGCTAKRAVAVRGGGFLAGAVCDAGVVWRACIAVCRRSGACHSLQQHHDAPAHAGPRVCPRVEPRRRRRRLVASAVRRRR